MKIPLLLAAFVVSASPALAASPAVSRGEELLAISFEDCIVRARKAFIDEGWKVSEGDNTSYALGRKGIHTAYITCSPGPDAKTWANVFVASYTQDSQVPGAERTRLQLRMAAAAPLGNFAGTWFVPTRFGKVTIDQVGDKVSGRYTEPAGTLTGIAYGDTVVLDFKDDAPLPPGKGVKGLPPNVAATGRVFIRLTTAKTLGGRWCDGACDPKTAPLTFTGRRQ